MSPGPRKCGCVVKRVAVVGWAEVSPNDECVPASVSRLTVFEYLRLVNTPSSCHPTQSHWPEFVGPLSTAAQDASEISRMLEAERNHGRSQPTYTGPDGQAILTIKANVWEEMRFVTTMVFKTISTEPIVLLLGIYNGFAYAILFLYLDGVFRVFVVNNGLSIISANLTYPTFAAGVSMMFAFVPVQNWLYARDRTRHGHNHPGARCSGFASAIAPLLIRSSPMAAGLSHLGVPIFENMSTKWAAATGFIFLSSPAHSSTSCTSVERGSSRAASVREHSSSLRRTGPCTKTSVAMERTILARCMTLILPQRPLLPRPDERASKSVALESSGYLQSPPKNSDSRNGEKLRAKSIKNS
ncbi:vitamin b6 transporter bsu1 [Drepanopeziza brunnea f. sp. 'multigermtubi' MB_m1]|uniref:Vitamin b6 transporter bsu1 n=1 Tax=Marssonina brunnea f. sp. multigermtubi (strain MB_m1) TaxID=1072389 RepID=K1XHX6_MARBU|nr:vitamin b6 transporter bsu1 [Drepanopeziza brunnea f. sp. 'multigermtubi' MB_m1]EKD12054.1 vitamin b6 transporter bsu1 [Drepanopeziza brunnea f. sp. 'multigermtubi' MB_m1]